MSVPRYLVEAEEKELQLAFALAVWYLWADSPDDGVRECPGTWGYVLFDESGKLVPEDFEFSCPCPIQDGVLRPQLDRCENSCEADGGSVPVQDPQRCIQEYMLLLARAILRNVETGQDL